MTVSIAFQPNFCFKCRTLFIYKVKFRQHVISTRALKTPQHELCGILFNYFDILEIKTINKYNYFLMLFDKYFMHVYFIYIPMQYNDLRYNVTHAKTCFLPF